MASSLAKVGRLAGKVCIVTGTGSGRGIGSVILHNLPAYAEPLTSRFSYASMNRFADEGMSSKHIARISWMTLHYIIGARHIYAMDIDSKDFHSLQASFEKTHPKTKVISFVGCLPPQH